MKIAVLILLMFCGSVFAQHQHSHIGHVHNHFHSGQSCPEEMIQNQLFGLQKNVNDMRDRLESQHIMLGITVFLILFTLLIQIILAKGKKNSNGKGTK